MRTFPYLQLLNSYAEGKTGDSVYAREAHKEDRYIVGGVMELSMSETLWKLLPRDVQVNLLGEMVSLGDLTDEPDTFGFWLDNGKIYWDLGTTHDDLVEAEERALERHQLAIWDEVGQVEVRLVEMI